MLYGRERKIGLQADGVEREACGPHAMAGAAVDPHSVDALGAQEADHGQRLDRPPRWATHGQNVFARWLLRTHSLSRHAAILSRPARHNGERSVGHRPLQLHRLSSKRAQPRVDLVMRGEDRRHSLRMDRADFGVRLRCQECKSIGRNLALPGLRTDFQRVDIPAKTASGRLSSSANHSGCFLPSAVVSYSENEVHGTTQRLSTPSQRRQCGEAVLRTFVAPRSVVRPFRAKTGDGMRHRAIVISRSPSTMRTIGAE